MKKIMDLLVKRLEEGKGSVLVSIVQNEGSAPRTTGANMLVGEEGYLCGTIGGGMLEFKATEQAQEDLKAGIGTLREYRLTKEAVANLGMVCGGDVDVLFSVLMPTEANREAAKKIQNCINRYEKGWLVLPLSGDAIEFVGEEKVHRCPTNENAVEPDRFPNQKIVELDGRKIYTQKLENSGRLYVFGGGHLSQELVPLAAHLGFRCVVVDDREEFASKERFPDAEEVFTSQFDELEGRFELHENDYVIAVTRGHAGDFEVQKFALKTPAYYIGVVGSKSKIAEVNRKLRECGYTDEDISRLTTPIGIKIHSETPAEIAVSIAAQLIEQRALQKRVEK